MQSANGTFTVNMTPQEQSAAGGATLGRMTLEKTFSGVLDGRSEGQMLTAMTPVQGSAAYVAVERFEGTLAGKTGSFALSHRGTMAGGEQSLDIAVVPDSGTDQLTGLSGTMTIEIEGGEHRYVFDYDLPAD